VVQAGGEGVKITENQIHWPRCSKSTIKNFLTTERVLKALQGERPARHTIIFDISTFSVIILCVIFSFLDPDPNQIDGH
jgi:hypothetical protein